MLVTGGAGYIGTHTVLSLLGAGASVVIVDNLCNSSAASLERVKELAGDKASRIVFHQARAGDAFACFLLVPGKSALSEVARRAPGVRALRRRRAAAPAGGPGGRGGDGEGVPATHVRGRGADTRRSALLPRRLRRGHALAAPRSFDAVIHFAGLTAVRARDPRCTAEAWRCERAAPRG